MVNFILILFLSVFSVQAFGESLSEVETLYRCYGHLTSKRLKKNDPLLRQVKAGQLSGVKACEKVLSSASIGTNGLLLEDSSKARSVLSTMTKLHMTFFDEQALIDVNNNYTRVSKDIYDEQSSALHFTKALFNSSHGVDDVLKAPSDLEGRRTDPLATAAGPSSRAQASDLLGEVLTIQK